MALRPDAVKFGGRRILFRKFFIGEWTARRFDPTGIRFDGQLLNRIDDIGHEDGDYVCIII